MDRAKESVLLGGREKKFQENIGRNSRGFSAAEFDAFLLFHSLKESFVLYCLFYVQFRSIFAGAFIMAAFVFPILALLTLLIANYISFMRTPLLPFNFRNVIIKYNGGNFST